MLLTDVKKTQIHEQKSFYSFTLVMTLNHFFTFGNEQDRRKLKDFLVRNQTFGHV